MLISQTSGTFHDCTQEMFTWFLYPPEVWEKHKICLLEDNRGLAVSNPTSGFIAEAACVATIISQVLTCNESLPTCTTVTGSFASKCSQTRTRTFHREAEAVPDFVQRGTSHHLGLQLSRRLLKHGLDPTNNPTVSHKLVPQTICTVPAAGSIA